MDSRYEPSRMLEKDTVYADLHMHSTESDGLYTPTELMNRAAERGMTHVALTDHDCMTGFDEAKRVADTLGITLIPGVEVSCGARSSIHVLGYGVDPHDPSFAQFCKDQLIQRETRAEAMVGKLCELGKPIDMARVRELGKDCIARPHIARVMVEDGHVQSVQEAFDRYLKVGKPAYVPKAEVRVPDAVKKIHAAGGVAVLAHPMELKLGDTMMISLIEEWHASGLDGLEIYHPSAANNQIGFLERLAKKLNMLVTGGCDFHGEPARKTTLGEGLERWKTMEQDMQALMICMERYGREARACQE